MQRLAKQIGLYRIYQKYKLFYFSPISINFIWIQYNFFWGIQISEIWFFIKFDIIPMVTGGRTWSGEMIGYNATTSISDQHLGYVLCSAHVPKLPSKNRQKWHNITEYYNFWTVERTVQSQKTDFIIFFFLENFKPAVHGKCKQLECLHLQA